MSNLTYYYKFFIFYYKIFRTVSFLINKLYEGITKSLQEWDKYDTNVYKNL